MAALQSKSVVIVGGSLTGLFHGLCLKRQGVDVTILEQDPNAIRSSHQAGIAFGPSVEELLAKYDDTGVQNCIPAVGTRIDFRKSRNVGKLNILRHQTSWALLYNILRANLDGLPSVTVPHPPPPREGDGKARYLVGRKVTEMIIGEKHENQSMRVGYVTHLGDKDGVVEQPRPGNPATVEYIAADLVIGADGLHSTMRRLLDAPGAPREYAGYVAWRGTVPEDQVSPETLEAFSGRTSLGLLSRNYFVVYPIPPDSGSFTPGSRLINWVWYFNIRENSEEMTEILTNQNGHVHSNTVPSGLVRPQVWEKYLAAILPHVAAPYAELLTKTKNPFVTKVNDVLCEQASFYDGRILLVGDTLATFRPHFAVATEKAARGALELGKVWDGEKTMEDWEKEMLDYEKKVWMGSRVLGTAFCRGWWEFARELGGFVWFLLKLKVVSWCGGSSRERPCPAVDR